MLTAVILVVFPFTMAYAAFSDLVSMTIANRVSVVISVAFLGVALAIDMPYWLIAQHLMLALVCLAATFGCFAAGWMGGGDAKLLAATALWFGPTLSLAEYLLAGAMLGAGLTLGLIAVRGTMVPATGIGFVDHLLQKDTGVPYGIALGAAGLLVYSDSDWVDIAIRGLS